MTTNLTKYDAARNALQIAVTVDEVKDIRDKSEAMAAYARQAKDTELLKWATEIKVRAERRAGQLLAEMPKATGAKGVGPIAVASCDRNQPPTLSDIGVTKSDSSRWQKLASISDEQFESAVASAKDKAGEVTTAAMMRAAKTDEEQNPEKQPAKEAKPKPKLISEERAAEITAENTELRERIAEIARDAQEAIEDNSQMAAIFEADDRLAAAMAEIKRLKAEVVSLKEQLAGAIGTRNEAIRSAKYYKAKCEKVAA